MTDQKPVARSRAVPIGGGIAAIVIAAVAGVTTFTGASEGEKHVAYQDFARGVWTICNGETVGVYPGMTATHAQCQAMLQRDLTDHAKAVLRTTPGLSKHIGALKAATDFSLNAGDGAYAGSTMARQFNAGNIRAGCDAFLAWSKARVNGVLTVVPGLLKRRQGERVMCLADAG